MEEPHEQNRSFVLGLFLFCILLCGVYKLILLSIAFFSADEIECNLLYCTFTTKRGTQTITQACFSNGVRVNCSAVWNNVCKTHCPILVPLLFPACAVWNDVCKTQECLDYMNGE